jgi:hypothetical protein
MPAPLPPRALGALLLAGAGAVFWPAFAAVKPTNFGGYDEWLILSLASRGVLGFPYANRPFNILWIAPTGLLAGHSLTAYLVTHVLYLLLGAALLFALCRRLQPARPLFAFLAAVFFLVYGPFDVSRLNSVQMSCYSGFTFGALLAVVLLVESWQRRRRLWLLAAALTALVVARSYEGTVPLLVGAPLLLLWLEQERSRRLWLWIAAYESALAAAIALILRPLLLSSTAAAYQTSQLGLNLEPGRVLQSLAQQYGFHLLPLLTTPRRELAVPAAALALLVFAAVFAAAARLLPGPPPDLRADRRSFAGLALLGLLFAGLGYGVMVLSNTVPSPFRMQFLSAPGIALGLASAAYLAASALPARRQQAAVAALAGWVVLVGSARTVFLQSVWDGMSLFPAQSSLLRQLVRTAPGLRPNTLVILVDGSQAFPETFTFRHALQYLYGPQVVGFVAGANNFLYATRFDAAAVRCAPWPIVRGPWSVAPSVHRYDETVVVRLSGSGVLERLPRWPADLPALAPGARYAPEERVLETPPAMPARAVLGGSP